MWQGFRNLVASQGRTASFRAGPCPATERPVSAGGTKTTLQGGPIAPYAPAPADPVVLIAANAGLGLTANRGLRELHTYHTPLDLVRERSPEHPVALVRRDAVAAAARWFQTKFKGDVLYAVKANPSPWVIETLVQNGVTRF
ncbi:MAG: decarboxylase, partial [Caulobacter sp.]|nr:decarboxylase [Caulobacter sp.]